MAQSIGDIHILTAIYQVNPGVNKLPQDSQVLLNPWLVIHAFLKWFIPWDSSQCIIPFSSLTLETCCCFPQRFCFARWSISGKVGETRSENSSHGDVVQDTTASGLCSCACVLLTGGRASVEVLLHGGRRWRSSHEQRSSRRQGRRRKGHTLQLLPSCSFLSPYFNPCHDVLPWDGY